MNHPSVRVPRLQPQLGRHQRCVDQRGRDLLRRPLGPISARIALANAFWDLLLFFDTHVFAIERQWTSRGDNTTYIFQFDELDCCCRPAQ